MCLLFMNMYVCLLLPHLWVSHVNTVYMSAIYEYVCVFIIATSVGVSY